MEGGEQRGEEEDHGWMLTVLSSGLVHISITCPSSPHDTSESFPLIMRELALSPQHHWVPQPTLRRYSLFITN